jgi:hypothetical protein
MYVKFKTMLKSSVATAALLAVAVPVVSSQAEAGIANGNDNALTVSGHINRSLIHADDGIREELFHVDGGTANSRMRFIASGSLTDQVSVGALHEMNMITGVDAGAFDFDGAGTVDKDQRNIQDWAARQSNVAFTHKAAGKLTIGKSTQVDNNATSAWGGNNFGTGGLNHSGAVTFVRSSTPGTVSTVTASSAFGMYDAGRGDQIRYDLPGGLPISAAVAYEDQGSYALGAAWGGSFSGIGVKLTYGYNNVSANSTGIDFTQHVSMALSHSSGLGLVARWGEENAKDIDTTDDQATGQAWEGEGRMVGVSYQTKNLTSLGSSHFRVTYGENDDTIAKGDSSERMGISYVQKMPAGTSMHIGYEEAEYETLTVSDYQDVSSIIAGVMVAF